MGHVDAQMNKTTTRRRAHVIATAHAHVFSNRLRANVPVQICVYLEKEIHIILYGSLCVSMVVCAWVFALPLGGGLDDLGSAIEMSKSDQNSDHHVGHKL